MCAAEVRETRFNPKAPSYYPWNASSGGSRFANLERTGSGSVRDRSRSSSFNSGRESRRRSQSLSIQLEARRPIFRIRVSNFSPDFDKPKFVELLNSMFSDIKSIDFQPRYNEKGRLFGFVTFTSEIGYNECIQLGTYTFGDDVLRIEPGQDKGTMPTSTTLVIKNVPLNSTLKEFEEWIRKQAIQPLSFTFIRSKQHNEQSRFSGVIFVQYRNIEDAGVAWGYIKDELFNGSKIEVEYKRRQDKREFENGSTPFFLSPIAEQLWSQLTQFKKRFVNSNGRVPTPSLVFPNNLSPLEKSIVFTYAEKLGLCHYTQGEGDEKSIFISTTPPSASTKQARTGRVSRAASVSETEETIQRRPRMMSCPDIGSDLPQPIAPVEVSSQRIALGPQDNSIGFTMHRTLL